MSITFSVKGDAVTKQDFAAMAEEVKACHTALHEKTGKGNDFVGWVDWPVDYDKEEFARIKKAAEKIQKQSEVLIVIGIGGSYLGTRTALDFIKTPFYNEDKKKTTPDIYFVGNNISSAYLSDILGILGDRDFSVNVISKSGTTTEPAIAFRIFKQLLETKYGKEGAAERIYATTDRARGALKTMCNTEGYETFVIPDDIGGRFTVLTAVGMLAMAVAGVDIDKVMEGAQWAREAYSNPDIMENPAISMRQQETSSTVTAKQWKSWQIMNLTWFLSANGINSFMQKAKAKTAKVFSLWQQTSPQTCTPSVSSFRKAAVISLKPLCGAKNLRAQCWYLSTKKTWMV